MRCNAQRDVRNALSRDSRLTSVVGRELGFPSYLTDDTVQSEIVLLDPIPLLDVNAGGRSSSSSSSSSSGTITQSQLRNDEDEYEYDEEYDDDDLDEAGGRSSRAALAASIAWPVVGYAVDVYMPAYRLVVEADGPSHWCRGTGEGTNRPLGRTVLKHRLLREAGYLLVSVPLHWTSTTAGAAAGNSSGWDSNDDESDGFHSRGAVATAWTGDQHAWKQEDLAGAESRSWPSQPSKNLSGRLLELILTASEETRGLGERRWDVAKQAHEMAFLTGETESVKPPSASSTAAAGQRRRPSRQNVSTGGGSIFLKGRQKQQQRKQQQQQQRHDGSPGGQRRDGASSGARHTSNSQQQQKRNGSAKQQARSKEEKARLAAARKLKERQQTASSNRQGRHQPPHRPTQRRQQQQRREQQSTAAGTSRRTGGGGAKRQQQQTGTGTGSGSGSPIAKLPLNPYDVLGVAPGATRREIKRAFRALSLRYHPDKNSEPGAAARFAELGSAAEQLLSQKQKQKQKQNR